MINQFQYELEVEGQNYLARSEFARRLDSCFGSTEEAYVKQAYLSRLEAVLREEKSRQGGSRISGEQMRELERQAGLMRRNPESIRISELPDEFVRLASQHRFSLVREALRDGSMVPRQVLEEYPAGVFREDIRSLPGSLKANHMVYTNLRAEMDGSLLDEFGVWARRQDGKKISRDGPEDIRYGLAAIFAVAGDLSGLLRKSGLTIEHTGGKRIFRQSALAAGLYQRVSQTILVGPVIPGCGGVVESLIHELAGHWLDAVSTPPQIWLDALFCPEDRFFRPAINTSFVDASLQDGGGIYPDLITGMNRAPDSAPSHLRPSLTTAELWARLAEQYVIEHLPEGLSKGAVMDREAYRRGVGYWTTRLWEQGLSRQVGEQIAARVWMAEKVMGVESPHKDSLKELYNRVFPWAAQGWVEAI